MQIMVINDRKVTLVKTKNNHVLEKRILYFSKWKILEPGCIGNFPEPISVFILTTLNTLSSHA